MPIVLFNSFRLLGSRREYFRRHSDMQTDRPRFPRKRDTQNAFSTIQQINMPDCLILSPNNPRRHLQPLWIINSVDPIRFVPVQCMCALCLFFFRSLAVASGLEADYIFPLWQMTLNSIFCQPLCRLGRVQRNGTRCGRNWKMFSGRAEIERKGKAAKNISDRDVILTN